MREGCEGPRGKSSQRGGVSIGILSVCVFVRARGKMIMIMKRYGGCGGSYRCVHVCVNELPLRNN